METVSSHPIVGQLALQAPHHHRAELCRIGRNATGKTQIVEDLQQGGEAFLIPVVWCCGQKELVLDVWSQQAHSLRTL